MLSTWNARNISNQVGEVNNSLGKGGSKARKALGDAGTGSENPPLAPGKSVTMSDRKATNQSQRRPLGKRSENAPAAGKGTKGLGFLSDSTQQKQRRALVDISNSGNKGSSAAAANGSNINGPKTGGGKHLSQGRLKFTVHSDSRLLHGESENILNFGGKSGTVNELADALPASPRFVEKNKQRKPLVKLDAEVDDVEMVMGRTGDEEEVFVQRRVEQRAAAKAAINPFKAASSARPNNGVRSSREAFAFSSASSAASSRHDISKTNGMFNGNISLKMGVDFNRKMSGSFNGNIKRKTSGNDNRKLSSTVNGSINDKMSHNVNGNTSDKTSGTENSTINGKMGSNVNGSISDKTSGNVSASISGKMSGSINGNCSGNISGNDNGAGRACSSELDGAGLSANPGADISSPNVSDPSMESGAGDQMVQSDFLEGDVSLAPDGPLSVFDDDDLDLDCLATAVEEELDSTPLSPLDDSFLTQEINLIFL